MGDASTPSSAAKSRGSHRGVELFCEEAAAAPRRRHFLDACTLCQRPLGRYCDVYMYRGDMPFCSEDCRQEQIDLDLTREEEEAGCRGRRSRVRRPSLASDHVSAGRGGRRQLNITRKRGEHIVAAGCPWFQ